MDRLNLRPHHILDIIATYGAGLPFIKADNGSAVPEAAEIILGGLDTPIRLVAGWDDICKPCRLLVNGRCTNVLSQLEDRPSMQEYNDALDRRLLVRLGMGEGTETTARGFLEAVSADLPGTVHIATHPGEVETEKQEKIRNGLKRLGLLPQ